MHHKILFIITLTLLGSISCFSQEYKTGLYTRSIKIAGYTRTYQLYLPSAYNMQVKLPLVIVIHGGGGTGRAAMKEMEWNKKAFQEGFIVVAPDALPVDPKKSYDLKDNPSTWNDGSGRFNKDVDGIDDVAFINAMIDDIERNYQIDIKRIYVTGFSNGASMTFHVGIELSARIAAIAPVAGALWITNTAPIYPLSLCYITGDSDSFNPINGGITKNASGGIVGEGKEKQPVIEHIIRWLSFIGCSNKPLSKTVKGGITHIKYGMGKNNTVIEYYIIEGCGHTWPGHQSLLPQSFLGATTDKMDATVVIWDFFKSIIKK